MIWQRVIPLAAFLIFGAHSASACQLLPTLKLSKIIEADVAMIGHIKRYDFRGRDSGKVAHAAITVQPLLPLRGLLLSEQVIYWENSTFRVPKEWQKDRLVFVAAKKIEPEFRQLRGGIQDQSGNDLKWEVLQPQCKTAFILEAVSLSSAAASFLVLATWMLPLILIATAVRFYFARTRRRPA